MRLRTSLVTVAALSCILVSGRASGQPAEAEPLPAAPLPPPPALPQPPRSVAPPPPPPEGFPPPPPVPEKRRERPAWGGLGYGSVGMMAGSFGALEETLSRNDLLGPGYGPAPAGVTFGGGGGALVGGRLWLGGGGYGAKIATTPTSKAKTDLHGGGGGLELGYAVLNADKWLLIPYVGFGGFGYELTITNLTNRTFRLFGTEQVGPGQTANFESGFWTGELGIRVFRLYFWKHGGFAVGADVGYRASLTRDSWHGGDRADLGQESARIGAGYLRLTLGGGGFFHQPIPED
jgi:hypothetical protein